MTFVWRRTAFGATVALCVCMLVVASVQRVGAQAAPVQRLQWFLSEASWDVATVNAQRLALLLDTPATERRLARC